ncbi:NAD(P)-binding protein [Atractiella rhizophila]|nr:NAD(P)-binding protein [Atractiella rhizophila]
MTESKPKILITGSTGLLGRSVVRVFRDAGHQVLPLSYSRSAPGATKLDLTDTNAVKSLLESYKPDAIVHCAAERRPDVAEKDPSAAERLNVEATRTLAQYDGLLVYVSTDYVFPGDAPESGYAEEDPTEPLNLYGKTKELGERETVAGKGKNVVVRVPILYGKAEYNAESAVNILVDVVLNKAGKEKVDMDDWAVRYPTHVDDVAVALLRITDVYLKDTTSPFPKILHYSSSVPYTKLTMCQLFASCLPSKPSLEHLVPIRRGPDLTKGETRRPKDCKLGMKAQGNLGLDLHKIEGEDRFRKWWTERLGQ